MKQEVQKIIKDSAIRGIIGKCITGVILKMFKMKLSVIVPVYNGEATIEKCLNHIFNSDYKNFEVVVIDDASTDSTVEKIKKFNCRIIRLDRNRGVANARNAGAKHAKSNILVFVDSDLYVHKDTFSKMVEIYKSNPDMRVIGAVNSGKYNTKKFGTKFLSLKLSYDYKWKKGEKYRKFSSFQSECCLIEKKIFEGVGGFNSKYKKAGVEEYEMGHRLIEKGHANYICRDVLYDHYYDSLPKRAYSLLRRTIIYTPLFFKKRKFETDGGTGTFFEFIMIFFSFTGVIAIPMILLSSKLSVIPFSTFAIIFLLNIKFLFYLMVKEGVFFSFRSFFALLYLYISMGLGIILGVFSLATGMGDQSG
ncbi:glycosyltransferase family 2 protein [Candidatus Woesearchaeota archaeon]|nr:glycosyltransferase family 2 protein [Candidatus Woesearchaeota archaeon]